MADDFEKAVLFAFDQGAGVSEDVRRQAGELLESVAASPAAWQLCLGRLDTSAYAEVKFWCLQTLNALARGPAYAALPPDAREQVKRSLLAAGAAPPPAQLPPFLRNKLAQAVVAVAAREFPAQWPTFFQDVLGTLGRGGAPAVDFFARVLLAVDEDIISLDVPRSADEAKRSMAFKDAMRERALGDVAESWGGVVAAYAQAAPDVAAFLLEAVRRYVHWVDISLVANDTFVPLLYAALNSAHEGLRGAAADVLTEIVSKRMEAIPKLTLIQALGVVPVCAQWSANFPGVEDERELAVKYARLLATLATEVLESWKKVENSVLSLEAVGLAVGDDAAAEAGATCAAAAQLLDALFPAVLCALRTGDDDIAAAVAPFLLSHVARLRALQKRGGGALPPPAAAQLPPVLEAVAAAARFSDDSSAYASAAASPVERVASEEEEAAVAERRQELFTLFKNAAKVAPEGAVAFVAARLEAALSRGDAPWQEVELALNLLYQLGEGAPEEALRPGAGGASLASLAAAVMRAEVPAARHRLVALALLEACARYARLLANQPALAPLVVARFLGADGLRHAAEDVPRRAAYLLCRVVKALRSQLKGLAPDVLGQLQPLLSSIARTPLQEQGRAAGASGAAGVLGGVAPAAAADDRLYAFEAAGLLLGLEDLPEEEQLAWLAALLHPLTAQLEDNVRLAAAAPEAAAGGGAPPAALVQQALEALTRLSKGFSPRLCTDSRPRVGALLAAPLAAAVEVPRRLPAHKALRAKYLAYAHRMVEVLGAGALPHLPAALQALLHAGADAPDLADVLALLNQLMLRFKAQLAPLVAEVLPVLCLGCGPFVGRPAEWAAPGGAVGAAATGAVAAGSTEDQRERAELQRAYYAFLHSLVHAELAGVLLASPPATRDAALGAVLEGAVAPGVDPSVRKTCIQTLGSVAAEWAGSDTAAAAAGGDGFRDFVIQRFGGEVLLESLVSPAGAVDVRDAAAISLLTEVAAQLIAVHKRYGGAFAAHLGGVVLPRMGWPPAAREQLLQHIAAADVKQLKAFLKAALLEQSSGGGGGRAGR